MKYALTAAALAAAVLVAGCTPEQRCKTGEAVYFATKDRGGEAERRAADIAYAELRLRCAAQGVILKEP